MNQMLDELENLIAFISSEYGRLYDKWKKSSLYIPINQKSKLVKNIVEDDSIYNSILNYRQFINENHLEFKMAMDKLNLSSQVNSRVKAQNSIEFKLENYMSSKHNFGEGPINKCFNDLYGIRIIFNKSVTHKEIENFIKKRFGNDLKCIDSSKGEYVATHIYFKIDNFSYQWELQVWNKENEKNNILSHEKYKQDYTKWEKENK